MRSVTFDHGDAGRQVARAAGALLAAADMSCLLELKIAAD